MVACQTRSDVSDDMYSGLAHDAFGNFIVSGTEKVTRYEDGEPVEWTGVPLTMEVLDPTTKR